jgi:outer membrane protein TolC
MAANRREALDGGQFNYTRVAALMGVRWDLTAARLRLEAAVADAEYRAMVARRDALEAAVEAEVAAAVAAVERSSRLLEAARRSHGAAQRWLRLASDNWDMGLGDLRRLIRAHEAFYSLRGEVIKAELEYRMTLIQLAHVLGDAAMYTRWCEHERLVLH